MNSLKHTLRDPLEDYRLQLSKAPEIQKKLIDFIKQNFTPVKITPDLPELANHIIYQAGIDRVIEFMEGIYETQDREIREQYSK